jgi:hypothetical protein
MRHRHLIVVALLLSQAGVAQKGSLAYGPVPLGQSPSNAFLPDTTTLWNRSAGSLRQSSERARPVQQPMPVFQPRHPQGLAKASAMPSRSFYKSKADWRRIIDSTWGPGMPLASKLALFDAYTSMVTAEFDGFLSLGLTQGSWDSFRNQCRSRIDSTTSRGMFASIMGHLAISLRDGHTWAEDTVLNSTPLAPGVPLLVVNAFSTADHFGAVLTALPDSSALVLRTVSNHPLGLEPGDVILGYEGVPWKKLVKELLEADLPVPWASIGAWSAESHVRLRNVGNNWHLFDTIDVLKHSTKTTMHLPVYPLLNLPPDFMMGNEQLDIPGMPPAFYYIKPDNSTVGHPVDYGILPGTDIGYIRLLGEVPTAAVDLAFSEAVRTLWDKKGLIIDLRYNTGGWAEFDAAFARMFSRRMYTINDAYRNNPLKFTLAPSAANSELFVIPGTPGCIYDRPLAVLLGPTCVSMGDITAQRFRYHPMVRFFGKAPYASHGDNRELEGYKDWMLHCSLSDMYHISQPGVYLNRSEFPIDEPVWFNADDVANGVDPVVQRALVWTNTLSYAHNVQLAHPSKDTLRITARVENPLTHALKVVVTLKDSLGALIDSLLLSDDGLHSDGAAGDGLWGYPYVPAKDGTIHVTIRTDDLTAGSSRTLPDASQIIFTHGALIALDANTINFGGISNTLQHRDTTFTVRNIGSAADSLTILLDPVNVDPATAVAVFPTSFFLVPGDSQKVTFSIHPQQLVPQSFYYCMIAVQPKAGMAQTSLIAYFTFQIVTTDAIFTSTEIPKDFVLDQNYPNPFNPSTTIRYGLPARSRVTLTIFNTLGQQVALLQNGEQEAGYHEARFEGAGVSSGIYFYRIEAGSFVQTRTLVLLR